MKASLQATYALFFDWFGWFLVFLTFASPLLVTTALELCLNNSNKERKDQLISETLEGYNNHTGEINYPLRRLVVALLIINSFFITLISVARHIQLEIILRLKTQYSRGWRAMNSLCAAYGISFSIGFALLAIVHLDTYPTAHKVIASIAFAFLQLWMLHHTILTILSLSKYSDWSKPGSCWFYTLSGLLITVTICSMVLLEYFAVNGPSASNYYMTEWTGVYIPVWHTVIIGYLFTEHSVARELKLFFFQCSRSGIEERCNSQKGDNTKNLFASTADLKTIQINNTGQITKIHSLSINA